MSAEQYNRRIKPEMGDLTIRQKRILIVDDHPVCRVVIAAQLENTYQVRTAATSRDAARKFAEGDFDLLISDYQLNEGDNAENLRNTLLEMVQTTEDADKLKLVDNMVVMTATPEDLSQEFRERLRFDVLDKSAHQIREIVGVILQKIAKFKVGNDN